MPSYEIIDLETANVLAVNASREQAVALVAAHVAEHGPDEDLALLELDDHGRAIGPPVPASDLLR